MSCVGRFDLVKTLGDHCIGFPNMVDMCGTFVGFVVMIFVKATCMYNKLLLMTIISSILGSPSWFMKTITYTLLIERKPKSKAFLSVQTANVIKRSVVNKNVHQCSKRSYDWMLNLEKKC